MTVMVPCENAGKAGLRRIIDEEAVKKVLARPAGRRLGDAEELEPPVQAQPRQDQDRRHLRARRGRAQPRDPRAREGPVDGREADVHPRQEDPRLRADVRAREGRGGGRGVPRRAARRERRARRSSPPSSRQRRHAEWPSPSSSPQVVASALGPTGPRRSSLLAGRPMLEWSLDALRAAPAIERIVVALPAGRRGARGDDRRPGRGGALALGAQRAGRRRRERRPGARPRRRPAAADARARRALPRGARGRRRRDRRRAGDRHDQGGGRRTASWSARSTARGCGRSRRRRSSAAPRSSACSPSPTRSSPPRPTTPRSSRPRGGRVRVVEAPRENLKVTTPRRPARRRAAAGRAPLSPSGARTVAATASGRS